MQEELTREILRFASELRSLGEILGVAYLPGTLPPRVDDLLRLANLLLDSEPPAALRAPIEAAQEALALVRHELRRPLPLDFTPLPQDTYAEARNLGRFLVGLAAEMERALNRETREDVASSGSGDGVPPTHQDISPSVQALLELRQASDQKEQAKKTAQRERNEKVHRAAAALRSCTWDSLPEEIRGMGTRPQEEALALARRFVLEVWLPAVQSVVALVSADDIERIQYPDATLVTFGRRLWLRLIRSEDRAKECEAIARELADAACSFMDLAEELHFFPGILLGVIEQLGYPRILLDPPSCILQPRSEPPYALDVDTQRQPAASDRDDNSTSTDPAPLPNVFRRLVDFWEIRFADKGISMKDSSGLRYIHRLLQDQGKRISLDTVCSLHAEEEDEDSHGNGLGTENHELKGSMEDEAIAELRDHLTETEAELEQAKQHNDLAAQERIQREMDAISAELGRTAGIRDRPRPSGGDPTEKARVRRGMAIGRTMKRLRKEHGELHEHLDKALLDPSGHNPGYLPTSLVPWVLI